MDEPQMEDGTTRTGSVNAVQRIGNTVRRQTGHWTPNVHALLRHLEANGFDRAPRVSGIDEYGREILSYVPGRVALKPWPPEMRHNDGIGELAAWLREYHEIVRDFVPPEPDTWRVPGSIWKAGCIVRHGDLGPGNKIWDRGHLAAVIDWDQAEPGVELDDIAQLAWYTVPLRGNEYAETVGGFATTDLRERLQILCQTHGQQPSNVLNAAIDIQTRELSRIETLGQREIEPWLSFFNRGDASEIHRERAWTENQRKALAS